MDKGQKEGGESYNIYIFDKSLQQRQQQQQKKLMYPKCNANYIKLYYCKKNTSVKNVWVLWFENLNFL